MSSLKESVDNSEIWTVDEELLAIDTLLNWETKKEKTKRDYYVHSNFAVKCIGDIKKVIKKKDGKLMLTKESVILTIKNVHETYGHKGIRKTYLKLAEEYSNITRKIVADYIQQCERCVEKLKKKTKAGLVVQPILANEYNERFQVDLVDYQTLPDGNYKYIMHGIDFLTKYHFLRPLTSKCASEVAKEILKIFMDFGAAQIIQSDNGREFTAKIIYELNLLWPSVKFINGRARYPQSQGSTEKGNDTLKKTLNAWMRDNNCTNWSLGLYFAQWSMNVTYSEAIKNIPYKAVFGVKPKVGLSTKIPIDLLQNIHSGIYEEDFNNIMEHTYFNDEKYDIEKCESSLSENIKNNLSFKNDDNVTNNFLHSKMKQLEISTNNISNVTVHRNLKQIKPSDEITVHGESLSNINENKQELDVTIKPKPKYSQDCSNIVVSKIEKLQISGENKSNLNSIGATCSKVYNKDIDYINDLSTLNGHANVHDDAVYTNFNVYEKSSDSSCDFIDNTISCHQSNDENITTTEDSINDAAVHINYNVYDHSPGASFNFVDNSVSYQQNNDKNTPAVVTINNSTNVKNYVDINNLNKILNSNEKCNSVNIEYKETSKNQDDLFENSVFNKSTEVMSIVVVGERKRPREIEADDEHLAIKYRREAAVHLKKQAQRMVNRSNIKLIPVNIGDCVVVHVSEFDRSKGDPPNLIGVIMSVSYNQKYQIGTKAGIIDTWLARNAFEKVSYAQLKITDVPDKISSIRSLAKDLSIGFGQNFIKCNCRNDCNNNRCKCLKNGLKCNSKCHRLISCSNHDRDSQ